MSCLRERHFTVTSLLAFRVVAEMHSVSNTANFKESSFKLKDYKKSNHLAFLNTVKQCQCSIQLYDDCSMKLDFVFLTGLKRTAAFFYPDCHQLSGKENEEIDFNELTEVWTRKTASFRGSFFQEKEMASNHNRVATTTF